MNIQEEVLEAQHQEWLKHPVTCSLLKALRKHQTKMAKLTTDSVYDDKVSSEVIRYHCVGLKNTNAVILLVTDFKSLVNYLNKE